MCRAQVLTPSSSSWLGRSYDPGPKLACSRTVAAPELRVPEYRAQGVYLTELVQRRRSTRQSIGPEKPLRLKRRYDGKRLSPSQAPVFSPKHTPPNLLAPAPGR
jgi:hypothetical protein